MAQNRLKWFFLANYLIGEISDHNSGLIGKRWVSMGLDSVQWTPPPLSARLITKPVMFCVLFIAAQMYGVFVFWYSLVRAKVH